MAFTFKNRQKAVAVFLLVGTFLLVVLGAMIATGSDLFTAKNKYYTIFTDAHGFTAGTKITYKGFKVGRITDVSITNLDRIRADLNIHRKYNRLITPNSVLKVQTALLGGSTLVLVNFKAEPDLPIIENIENIENFENKTEINTGKKADEKSEDSSFTQAEPKQSKAQSMIQRMKHRNLIYSSDSDEGQKILNSKMAANIASDELTEKVKMILDDIHSLKPTLDKTMGNISKSTENLSVVLAGLRGTQKTALSEPLLAALRNTSKLTKNLEEFTTSMNSKENSFGYMVNDKRKLANKVESVLSNMDKATHDLKVFTSSTVGKKEDVDRIMKLLTSNLIELRKLLKGMQNVFGTNKKR